MGCTGSVLGVTSGLSRRCSTGLRRVAGVPIQADNAHRFLTYEAGNARLAQPGLDGRIETAASLTSPTSMHNRRGARHSGMLAVQRSDLCDGPSGIQAAPGVHIHRPYQRLHHVAQHLQ